MKAHEGSFHYRRYARARVTGKTVDAFRCLHRPLFSMQGRDFERHADERLAGPIRRWRQAQCVACPAGSSNPAILHREFVRWSSYRCTLDEFTAALECLGFALDCDGMVSGLILQEDFKALRQYERQRCGGRA
jgi:hypothetical protein